VKTKRKKASRPPKEPKPRRRRVTPEQQATYGILVGLHLRTGIPPSLDEIADSLLISKNSVARHMRGLESHGMIERKQESRRSWQSTAPEHTPLGLLRMLAKMRVTRKGSLGDFEAINCRLSEKASKGLKLVMGE
jgi:SOS-response transcriptional repressor LexA